ncbi:MAG: amidohydrolase family protein [Planctomycetes bacterium]|nr:amidohydrolase family protein [Planctomycetota bacterium]
MSRFLFSNGLLVDGTGIAARNMDVLVQDGVIEDILPPGNLLDTSAETIDCNGSAVAPGFIDRHAHSDFSALVFRNADSKLAQGVTTEVNGHCGLSPFPLASGNAAEILKEASNWDVDVDWSDAPGYRAALQKAGSSINRMPFVGHGVLRGVIASFEDRLLSEAELPELARLVQVAVDGGARGVSAGLIYPPGCFSGTDELVVVARVAARNNIPLAMHVRGEGDRLEKAIGEVVRIARESEARIHVAHLKTYGPRNWSKIDWLLETLEDARRSGLDITADRYPYLASHTGLSSILPLWAQEGGDAAVLERLRSRSLRGKIMDEISLRHPDEEDYWDRIVVSDVSHASASHALGRSIAEIAGDWKTTPPEAAVRLLIDCHNSASAIFFMMNQDNLSRILKEPYVAIASDAAALSLDTAKVEGRPHPRAYGTFPRILARHVREKKTLSLEEAVRKMTSLPAESLNLADRGVIRPGMIADIVVFDPDTVIDNATFNNPVAAPDGVSLVMVNGCIVCRDGRITDQLPGVVI